MESIQKSNDFMCCVMCMFYDILEENDNKIVFKRQVYINTIINYYVNVMSSLLYGSLHTHWNGPIKIVTTINSEKKLRILSLYLCLVCIRVCILNFHDFMIKPNSVYGNSFQNCKFFSFLYLFKWVFFSKNKNRTTMRKMLTKPMFFASHTFSN